MLVFPAPEGAVTITALFGLGGMVGPRLSGASWGCVAAAYL